MLACTSQLLESGELGAECVDNIDREDDHPTPSPSTNLPDRDSPASKPRIRFQEGNVDEVRQMLYFHNIITFLYAHAGHLLESLFDVTDYLV